MRALCSPRSSDSSLSISSASFMAGDVSSSTRSACSCSHLLRRVPVHQVHGQLFPVAALLREVAHPLAHDLVIAHHLVGAVFQDQPMIPPHSGNARLQWQRFGTLAEPFCPEVLWLGALWSTAVRPDYFACSAPRQPSPPPAESRAKTPPSAVLAENQPWQHSLDESGLPTLAAKKSVQPLYALGVQ